MIKWHNHQEHLQQINLIRQTQTIKGIMFTFLLLWKDSVTKVIHKRKFIGDLQFQRASPWPSKQSQHWNRSWELTSDSQVHGRESWLALVWIFKGTKSIPPSDTSPLTWPHLLILSAWDEIFKYTILWGHFHSKHHPEK